MHVISIFSADPPINQLPLVLKNQDIINIVAIIISNVLFEIKRLNKVKKELVEMSTKTRNEKAAPRMIRSNSRPRSIVIYPMKYGIKFHRSKQGYQFI